MKNAPQTKAAPQEQLEEITELEITEEDCPELSALVDEALVEIEAGQTRPWH